MRHIDFWIDSPLLLLQHRSYMAFSPSVHWFPHLAQCLWIGVQKPTKRKIDPYAKGGTRDERAANRDDKQIAFIFRGASLPNAYI